MSDSLSSVRTPVLAAVFALVLALCGVWFRAFPSLRTAEAPRDIASIQFAFTERAAQRVVASWDRNGLADDARRALVHDGPFILLYGSALAIFGVLSARAAAAAGAISADAAEVASRRVLLAALAAALLDLLENAGTWLMLNHRFAAGAVPAATSSACVLKLAVGLIAAGCCFVLLARAVLHSQR